MKRFVGKVLFFLVICLVIAIIIPAAVDPYNVFHYNNIRNYEVEPNKNYVKTRYVIENPNKYDGFLFGSSRVGSIHVENISGYRIYNMTYSEGTPQEHLGTLRSFLNEGVNVEIVYMGIDSLSYTIDPSKHIAQPMRCPYQYLMLNPLNFIRLYASPYLAMTAIRNSGGGLAGYDVFYDYGWWCDYGRGAAIDWDNAAPVVGDANRLDETLLEIQEMKDICTENDIQLVVFTNPMFEITYEASVEQNYLEFLDRLADIIGYYNFSGINGVTVNTGNYIDTSHYNAYIGDMLIDVMCNDYIDENLYNQGFGWYVTSENVDDLLDILWKSAINE